MSEIKKKVKKGVDKLAKALESVERSNIVHTGKEFAESVGKVIGDEPETEKEDPKHPG